MKRMDINSAEVGRRIGRCLLFSAIPAGLFYMAAVYGLFKLGFNITEILRDPAQQSGASSFLGLVSNIGVGLWVSSAAICLFSVRSGVTEASGRLKELLYCVGALSLLLAIDDFFLIHDRYVNQYICYGVYAVLAAALLIRHFDLIIRIDGICFLLAGCLLASSILTDTVQHIIPVLYSYSQLFEEGVKFVGAAVWLHFCFSISSFRDVSAEQDALRVDLMSPTES